MEIESWLSWEYGIDITASTVDHAALPNLVIHAARRVFTPVGNSVAGLVLFTPPRASEPTLRYVVAENYEVGRYCATRVFAGTPFENAEVCGGEVTVEECGAAIEMRVKIASVEIEARLENLGVLEEVMRPPGVLPYSQNQLEAGAQSVALRIDGIEQPLYLPPGVAEIAPLALWKPCGHYSR